jgi:DNA-directed RNA polymerase subunit RPC12/RpoP
MLVFCEECGKRYSFPPEEFEPGSSQFRCRACGFIMAIKLPEQTGKADKGKKKAKAPGPAKGRGGG